MSSTLPAPKIREPIPGYIVKERIGVGGYGEVWSAQAPGDLMKAIKFVYGYFDDNRAARELKALNRIKQCRHPFLLSLERFEIVDGQLIIVTELADMSLKDRFEQAQREGLPGIQREELLGYMRDAADALDYMRENFTLQHLDVKPENLLLVGGRVKVADFGLVKELHDVTASMMGGLTPIYASPEVFDDRPSEHSDQYSLAIVYQEMICGVLPFPGRTPAQLASQHLHARPRVAPLSAVDQPIISRALSKDPRQRFASCRELIDCLLAGGTAKSAPATASRPPSTAKSASDTTSVRSREAKTDSNHHGDPEAGSASSPPAPNGKTLILGEAPVEQPSELKTDTRPAVPVPSQLPAVEPLVDLQPLDIEATFAGLQPTLFLGVGGTGARALRRLRRRLRDRFGTETAVPMLQLLLLDTDVKAAYQATQGENGTALADNETLALPLRNAADYTNESRSLLQWLSRRWLYNIPRSLQTEGRRPLGRLALVDHAPRVLQRLRKALAEITSSDAMTASTQATGLPVASQQPRVFLISSTSGGTGGGMVLDLAYLVRKLVTDLGLSDEGVCGILTHSTDRNPNAHELAIANSYACLTELHQYAGAEGYPGEPACELPPSSAGRGPFSQAYFVHLGDDLNDPDFDAATDALASYLYLDCMTPVGSALGECRRMGPADVTTDAGFTLRSFGMTSVGAGQSSLPALATEELCQEVVDRWRGVFKQTIREVTPLIDVAIASERASDEKLAQIDPRAAEHAASLALNVAPLCEQLRGLLETELGGDSRAVLSRLRAKAEQRNERVNANAVAALLRTIGDLFGASAENEGMARPSASLEAALDRDVRAIAEPKAEAIRGWILELIDEPHARVGGACRARDWYAAFIRALDSEAAETRQGVQADWQALERTLVETERTVAKRSTVFGLRRGEKPNPAVDAALLQIVRWRIEDLALFGLSKLFRQILSQIATAGDQLKDVQRTLGQLSATFEADSPWQAVADGASPKKVRDEVRVAVTESLRRMMPDLVDRTAAGFQSQFLDQHGGLRNLCKNINAMQSLIPSALRAQAQAQIFAALKEIPVASALLGPAIDSAGRLERLNECIDAARPRISNCGGGQRLLAILPNNPQGDALRAAVSELKPPATVVGYSEPDVVFAFELQDLSIPHVAARLIEDRTDFAQMAGRLHTRIDVAWTPLAQLAQR
jgi:eukaryotic-like serine/threonine-protein kinase